MIHVIGIVFKSDRLEQGYYHCSIFSAIPMIVGMTLNNNHFNFLQSTYHCINIIKLDELIKVDVSDFYIKIGFSQRLVSYLI